VSRVARTPSGRWPAKIALLLALVPACVFPTPAGAAEPLRIENLQVEGGEENWHPSNVFRLDWTPVPVAWDEQLTVVYRLFAADGSAIGGPVRYTKNASLIERLEVPETPGTYTVEVHLEDDNGTAGPPARAMLRFDDTVPPAAAPQPPAGWLAGHEVAEL
jgi:hypothetical protein